MALKLGGIMYCNKEGVGRDRVKQASYEKAGREGGL